jgi:hypothetical protein
MEREDIAKVGDGIMWGRRGRGGKGPRDCGPT